MMNPTLTSKEKQYLILILSLILLLKIFIAFLIHAPLKSDSVTYNNLAKSILSGEYSLNGKSTAFVVCGYPLFLSFIYFLFGEGQFYVKVIQSLIEIFTCYFFLKVSLRFLNKKYSFISLILFSFLPSNVLFSQTILTESLFGFFLILILYFCLKENFWNNIFLTGILFGCAVMIRSSFSFAVLLIPVWLFIKQKSFFKEKPLVNAGKYSVIFFAGVFLIIAPWIIRNKIVLNSFTLATQGGSTLWEGNNPLSTGTWNSQMVNNSPLFNEPDEIKRDKEFYKVASDFIISNPLKFFSLGVKKLGYLFSSERMIILYFTESDPGQNSTEVYRSVNPLIILLVNIPYLMIMFFGTWGLLALKANRFFIYGFILVAMITVFIFVGLARYHYTLIPFFTLGTAIFLSKRKDFFKNITLPKKITGIAFNIFLVSIWISEIYLMIK